MRPSIPIAQYREILSDIQRMNLGCQLLIVYFDSQESILVKIEDNGELEICSNFSAIGSGMYIAESVLFQREHSRGEGLANAIYHVYEAMRLGAYAPGVGGRFVMGVVQFSGAEALWTFVEPRYMKLLAGEFKKFGPKELKGQIVHRGFLQKLYAIDDDVKDKKEKPRLTSK
jgi:20S proteasome alpha/beta subunit